MEEEVRALVSTYTREVLSRRTRVVKLLGRKCDPQILYTFLGFELKMGRKRVTCPDMTTARYLSVFAQVGMSSIHVPYDPTQTQRLVTGIELLVQRIKELLLTEQLDRRQHQRRLRRIYTKIRQLLKVAEQETGKSRKQA